jgi:membrane fusion protein, macrolide-specific efflux system
MMKNKVRKIILLLLVLSVGSAFLYFKYKKNNTTNAVAVTEIHAFYGNIHIAISTTGTVEPQNRLEIKPPIAGRIEKILVKEGQNVKIGDVLALMSSTERATLLDAAKLEGEENIKYWENVYKTTPLIAPIDGEVIVRAVEPGQTVVASDAIIVLSDRLIVKAQVDETDIGSVQIGQKATISLDAYPEIKTDAVVDHISYESTVVNNVTIYKVDILPDSIPEVFRSGMSASIEIIKASKDNVLLVPIEAIKKDNNQSYVMLGSGQDQPSVKKQVQVGIINDENAEIISGLTTEDTLLIKSQTFTPQKTSSTGSNPFMPKFKKETEKTSK